MSYRNVSDELPSLEHWLQRYEKCEAERVRWFLKDVLEYVQRSFADAQILEENSGYAN